MTTTRTRASLSAAAAVLLLGAAACSGEPDKTSPTSGAPTSSGAPSASTSASPGGTTRTQMALTTPPTTVASPKAADTPPSQLFAPDNVFRVDVSKAPKDQDSAAMIKNLQGQITPHWGGVAAFNTHQYNPSFYVVDNSVPKQDVAFYDCQKKGAAPAGLLNGPAMFKQVPVPRNAQPASGTDKALSIYNKDTDQLWEFWVMEPTKGAKPGWRACWGGRIDNVSTAPGYYDQPFGVAASGLAHVGYMISLQEARTRKIEHAMGIGLIATRDASQIWYPANRSDGNSNDPTAIPEGARLRLDPSVDVEKLQLSPIGKAVARAAQKYGFIVVDTSGAVALYAESGQPEKARTGKDPWPEILGGQPNYKVLEGFPWDKVQVVQREYGKPGS
ncbi:hypothetical protein GGG17_09820 [Arsenicicoccus sp. MKL-02]|uniref:Lipoprotein n=1 Tax=Arsenicicoccus cauae TaxID=2663847 RepID=A0A6I3IE67_9MICO|nr:hypothetical protein [Arsenicicoccus cauae]MTB72262.1 hypothetical protein [Arsenicicoccus cauae]